MLDEVPYRRKARNAALPLSLLVHAALLGLLLLLPKGGSKANERKRTTPVAFRKIDAKQWAKAREVPPPKGQIVDVAPGNDRRPTESKFIAETDNTVKKETRAKEQVLKYSRATPKTQKNPEAAPAVKGNIGGRAAPPVALVPQNYEPFGGGQPKTVTELMREATKGKEKDLDADEKAGQEDGEAAPTATSDAAEPGGGAPADKLDVPEGDGTYLNTQGWKYAGFFNRVKQSVAAKWDPMRKLKERDAQARALTRERTTVLGVSLRPDGTIVDLFVRETSGVEALDIEAMQAFEKAAPFSNPPAALVRNGVIQFAFSFNVMNH